MGKFNPGGCENVLVTRAVGERQFRRGLEREVHRTLFRLEHYSHVHERRSVRGIL